MSWGSGQPEAGTNPSPHTHPADARNVIENLSAGGELTPEERLAVIGIIVD